MTWVFGQFSAQQSVPTTPFVGIRYTALDPLGVRVEQVLPGSPAAQAGLTPGDLIYTVDGVYVNGESLLAQVMTHGPADVLMLGIQRGDQKHQIEVQIANRPEHSQQTNEMISLESARNGFHMAGLIYDIEDNIWLVEQIDASDTLHAAGLRVGDRITAINGQTVTPATHHHLTASTLVEDVVQLTVERDNQLQEIEIPAVMIRLMLMHAMQTAGLQ